MHPSCCRSVASRSTRTASSSRSLPLRPVVSGANRPQGLDREKFLDMGFWSSLRQSRGEGVPRPRLLAAIRGAPGDPPFGTAGWSSTAVHRRDGRPASCTAEAPDAVPAVADASSLGSYWARLRASDAPLRMLLREAVHPPWRSPSPTPPASRAPVPLHPTQIYESAGASPSSLPVRHAGPVKTPGMRFWTMLILYGAARSFFEIFRADPALHRSFSSRRSSPPTDHYASSPSPARSKAPTCP